MHRTQAAVLALQRGELLRLHAQDAGTAHVKTLLVAWLLCGVAQAGAAPITLLDDAGHRLTLAGPAQRVVSLAPHLTEMVYAVGAGSALKAVIRHSDHPPEALRLPVVADAFTLDFEALLKLKPDLVLVWGSGLNERHKAHLRELGLTLFESEIRQPEGIAHTLRTLGTLLGHAAQAEDSARSIERQWDTLRARYAGRPPVRVFWQVWDEPLITINREHLISQTLAACGGVNVFAGLPALTPTVGWEAAVQANPQLIASAGKASAPAAPGPWARFPGVDAVRHQQVVSIAGDLITRMGPRYVDGAWALCEAIERARLAR
jgi:iron complex transport system substrate-binding protein